MGAVDTIEDKVIAVLHDVIEDCGGWAAFTLDLPADLTADLTSMTRRSGPSETHPSARGQPRGTRDWDGPQFDARSDPARLNFW